MRTSFCFIKFTALKVFWNCWFINCSSLEQVNAFLIFYLIFFKFSPKMHCFMYGIVVVHRGQKGHRSGRKWPEGWKRCSGIPLLLLILQGLSNIHIYCHWNIHFTSTRLVRKFFRHLHFILNTMLYHHHHHIHFRALFSSTEGWAFWQVFLAGVLSTQNDSEGQQNPYLASLCHSQALHPMISLACQIFSVQPHSACVLLQSSLCCALHVQTISSYWCGAPHLSPGCQALWEGSLS